MSEKVKNPFEKLSEPLSKEDIEFRIGNSNGKTGFSLLAYKTARVDTKRLNDVFGAGWTNRFFYDEKSLLCCEISIYVQDLKQWVGRIDVGTESQTEKEKGSYSDAFKRAGFKWGIGAELYDFPFMWVKWDVWEDKNGKKYPKFMAGNIKTEEYLFQDGEVKKLKLSYDGKIIFEIGKNIKVTEDEEPKEDDKMAKYKELVSKTMKHFKMPQKDAQNLLNSGGVKFELDSIQSALNDFDALIAHLERMQRGEA